ncbi:Hypothetical Protein FCC1311_049102 [Hondaea fermentalgiana]|uniref:PH domain-containing protein n=1 Tax=Hondaea fermentalgiana TaxID=2315210 RepID=A0A2R5GED5_9STRA|nr:Hypothetical Protein FCC1311_049102 [Hondaea fermentalgiana]|eukprot:GBG28689.1 Hypothetical Protein FCC1311_049102 [Hondaea fermentalgiana]
MDEAPRADGRFRRRVQSWEAWDLDRFPWEHDVGEMEDVREYELRPLFAAATLRARIADIQAEAAAAAATSAGVHEARQDGDSLPKTNRSKLANQSSTRSIQAEPSATSSDTEALDVCHWYARLEDGVHGLWASLEQPPSPQSSLPPLPPTIAPGGRKRNRKRLPRVIDVREPWQNLARLRAILHICVVRRRGGSGGRGVGGNMSVIRTDLARVLGELIFTLQRSHRARLHVLRVLATSAQSNRGLVRKVAQCLVQSVLHPLAISETVLLEWLAHVLIAVSSSEVGKASAWYVLEAVAAREDCGLGGPVGPEACKRESLELSPTDWVLHAPPTIRRVAQLVAASAADTDISPERFLVEAWLVPRLVALGRDDDAAAVSREGLPAGVLRALLKTKVPSPDQCERGELCGLATLRGDELAALAHVAILVAQSNLELGEIMQAGKAAQLTSPIERLTMCADALRGMDFSCVNAEEWYAIPLQDFRAHRLARCDADKVAWVCLRISALQNLTMRVEETLAREALLRDGSAALRTRCMEMASIVDELASCRGECTMIWEFIDQIRSSAAYLSRLRADMSSEGAISEDPLTTVLSPVKPLAGPRPGALANDEAAEIDQDGLADDASTGFQDAQDADEIDEEEEYIADKAIMSLKEPCSMLEIVYHGKTSLPPRACVYELSEDEAHVCISSEVDFELQESFALTMVDRVEMGLSEVSSRSGGLGSAEASLGCCFFMELQNGIILQLVAPSETQALAWTFGIQQLASDSAAQTLSPQRYRALVHEFARRRQQLD